MRATIATILIAASALAAPAGAQPSRNEAAGAMQDHRVAALGQSAPRFGGDLILELPRQGDQLGH